jgi:hypothetical protein
MSAKNTQVKEFSFDNIAQSFFDDVSLQLDSKSGSTLNVLEFVEQELNLGITLTPQQILILKGFYGLELTVAELSIIEYWECEYNFTYTPGHEHQGLILGIGRRAGKSLLASIITAFEFYKLCRLESPQEFYNISRSSWIGILVIATTATQSKDTIFGSVLGVFQNCRYFKQLEATGDLFIGTEYITLKSKLITIKSGNSKSASQVGGNLICLVMDEFALFTSEDGKSNAMNLWSALGISLSPFGHAGKRLAISSAICEGDAIEELRLALMHNSNFMTAELPSWAVNPSVHKDTNPITQAEYDLKPIVAALHYENKRGSSENAYLDPNEIDQAFTGHSCITSIDEVININGSSLISQIIQHIDRSPMGVNNFLHFDSSIKTDSYALCFGHTEFNKQNLTIDGTLVWKPEKDTPVYFKSVYESIVKIHKHRPLYKVSTDQYGASAETIQNIHIYGIKTQVINFTNTQQIIMYKTLKNLLGERRLILPKDCRWRSLTTKELKELLLLEMGKTLKVDHPLSGSKDIADCIASISWLAISENLIVTSSNNSAMHNFGTPKTTTVRTVASLDPFNQPNPFSAKSRYNDKKASLANIKRHF